MYQMLLLMHIFGAVLVGGFILSALVAIFLGHINRYAQLAQTIAIGFGIQLTSGSLLTLIRPGSMMTYCVRIGFYIVTVATIEILLYIKMTQSHHFFPWKLAGFSGGFGLVVSALTLLWLV